MAWPATKLRSGGSRREMRGRLYGAALGVGAVLLGLILLLVDHFAPSRMSGLRRATLTVTGPVWGAARVPVDAAAAWAGEIGNYWNAANRARELEAELAVARRYAAQGALLAAENRRLKQLLHFAEVEPRRVVVARVAGGSGASLVETAVIGAGTGAGVRTGQPVLTDSGLLGRVTEVAMGASRVLLVSDTESRVPVRVLRTGTPAVLAGVGGGMTELRYVSASPENAPRVGDLIVTSGDGGLFAPDVPVARVVALHGETARAVPLARPDTLGLAVVEQAWLPAPPAPPPAGTTSPKPVRMAVMVNP